MVRSLIGTRIRERRRTKKLTQTALAKKAGISTSYMNLIEHNHRGIAGRTLLLIAEGLDIDPKELSEEADHSLLTQLQEAAFLAQDTHAEIHRLEEYVGTFPGWAQLCARLYENIQQQEQKLQALSDRLGRDPFFSEAMHLMLSNVTVLQSTSDILASTPNIPPSQSARFIKNMRNEGQRLADTISKLLTYFDNIHHEENQTTPYIPQSKLDQFWASYHYHLSDIEKPERQFSETLKNNYLKSILNTWNFHETGEEEQAKKSISRYIETVQKLPFETFMNAAENAAYNPLTLAAKFNCNIHDVFFRLAHLPNQHNHKNLPQFGLIECDGAGGVLFQRPLKMLSLPRRSNACPLWPLYRAISQPMQPSRCIMEMPTGESFMVYAYAKWVGYPHYGIPQTIRSAMLFTLDYQHFPPAQARRSLPVLNVGLSCQVCPRKGCPSMRSQSILNT